MIGDQWMRSLDVWLCMPSWIFFLHKQLLVYHDLYYSCLSVWPWEAHVFAPWAPWNTRGWTATPALLQVLAGCHSWWLMAHPNSSTFIRFSDFGLSWNASRLAWHSHTQRQLALKKSLQWWLPLASRIPKFGGNCCTCTVPRRLQKVYRRNMYFATLGTPSWQDVDRRPTRGLSTNPRYPRRRTALFETVKVDVVWAPCIGSSDVTTARRAASWASCPPQRCVPGCQSDPVSKLSSGQHHLIRWPQPLCPLPHWGPMGPLSLRGGGKFESTTIALSWAPRLRPLKKSWLHLATIGHGWGLRFRGCHLEQWQVPDEAEDQVQPHLQRQVRS